MKTNLQVSKCPTDSVCASRGSLHCPGNTKRPKIWRPIFFSFGEPFLLQGSEIEVTEDREAVLDCVSPGGKPAADVGDFLYNQNKQKITEKKFGKKEL